MVLVVRTQYCRLKFVTMRKRLFGEDGCGQRGASLRSRVGEQSTASEGGTGFQSLPFSELMKRDWADGKLSSRQVQEYCAGAAQQGSTSAEVRALAATGARGNCPQNTQRDIMRILGRPRGAPELYYAKLPLRNRNGVMEEKQHPFLLPHEYFAKLYNEQRDFFGQHVLGGAGELEACWDMLAEHEFVRSNPYIHGSDAYRKVAVPLGLHGDAGAMSKQNSALVLTWNSLAGQGSSKQTRCLITVIRKDQMLSDGSTLEAIWDVISWSLNALATGKYPSKGHADTQLEGRQREVAGQWLAEGRQGLTLQMRGDWQWFCQCFGFPQWNGAVNMCWICKAGNRQKPWTDFRQTAEWRGTERNHERYLADLAGSNPPRIFQIIGFRHEGVVIDVMHCVDLGVALHVVGNVFYEIVQSKVLGRTQAESVGALSRDLASWYKAHKVPSRFGALQLEHFKQSGKAPKFRGKAAVTRHIVPFVVSLCTKYNKGTQHDQFRLACATALASFYGALEACPRRMSMECKCELAKFGREICSFYAALSAHNAPKTWKLTPKFHLLLHLVEIHVPRWGNPRFFWCYADEDLIGQIVEVAGACHPSTMADIALYKHCLMRSLSLSS